MALVIGNGFIAYFGTASVLTFGTAIALTSAGGHIVGYLSLLGALIPPLGGLLVGHWIAGRRGGKLTLSTLTEKSRRQAIALSVLGAPSACVSNEIEPANGVVVTLVLASMINAGGARSRG